MVLRVWTEEGSSEPLRVHVRETHNLSRGFRRSLTLTDVNSVLAAVRQFLQKDRPVGPAGSNRDG